MVGVVAASCLGLALYLIVARIGPDCELHNTTVMCRVRMIIHAGKNVALLAISDQGESAVLIVLSLSLC